MMEGGKLSVARVAFAVAALALALPAVAVGSPSRFEPVGWATAPAETAAFPTAPDFEIYDPHPPGFTERRADVAYNPDAGSYLVVWERSHTVESYDAVAGAIVTATAGAPFTIHGTLHGDQRNPDVAYASGPQQYLVAWESHGPYTVPPDIRGATVDATGTNIGQSLTISVEGPSLGQQTDPAVAACGTTGRWLVAWLDTRNQGTTGYDIYAQQVGYVGPGSSRWGPTVPVGAFTGEAGPPAIDWGPVDGGDGEFLVVWIEWQTYDTAYARRVEADSNLVGEPIVVCDTSAIKSSPAVAYAPTSSDWWVAWESG